MTMERGLAGVHVQFDKSKDCDCSAAEPQECRSSWYLSKKEIEEKSPSRKDGVDLKKESQLQMLFCSFLQDICMKLGVPQITYATAVVLCHRFYLHQSHAKNEWQTIATACMFLASKVEDTPCLLEKVIIVAYETMYRRNPAIARRIHQKVVFERQKALILTGERLLLCTVRYDLNIQHPYEPLLEALKKLRITEKDVRQTAWNFINDWLRTTLCLQHKPHYIAAGSLYLAAKLHNLKLPSRMGYVWWHEFDVAPRQLDAVVKQMMELFNHKKGPVAADLPEKQKPLQVPVAVKVEASSSTDSCVLSRTASSRSNSSDESEGKASVRPTDNTEVQCNLRDPESPNGVVENCDRISEGIGRTESESIQIGNVLDKIAMDTMQPEPIQVRDEFIKIDVDRIKALVKKRKREKETKKTVVALDGLSEDAWIERKLETGIEWAAESSTKKSRLLEVL